MFDLKLNGYPVVFTLRYVTEPGEGWKGSQYVGSYKTLEELNEALAGAKEDCPPYWQLEVDLADMSELDE